MLKDSSFVVKLGVSLVLSVLGFMLLHHRFFDYSPLVENILNNSTYVEIQENADQIQPAHQGLIYFFYFCISLVCDVCNFINAEINDWQ